ncbi:MAG: UDP-N-acetylmuramate dehydrogenase [Desulfatiglandales bacterium]
MDAQQKHRLIEICGEGVRFDCPMKAYTTFRVGGNAEAVCFIRRTEDLLALLSFLKDTDTPCLVVGRGSNLLVRDGGIKGVVITLQGALASLEGYEKEGGKILAGGGLTILELLAYCKKKGLGGLEFLCGIPGTAGGAVVMNAGAWGETIGEKVEEVQILNPEGKFFRLDRSVLGFSYRNLLLPMGSIVLRVALGVVPAEPRVISDKIADYLKKRGAGQPLRYPSAGSVFRNPPEDHAGRLIEMAGLKGARIGGAMISEQHANFIVNRGDASASDILALMEMAQRAVKEQTGVDLEPEIRIVGQEVQR